MAETATVKTLDDYPSLGTRVVRHGLFWYYRPEEQVINGEEKVILVQHTAFNGEEVELFVKSDLERADKFGALYQEGAAPHLPGATPPPPPEEEDEEVELSDLDHEDLVDWLMSTGAFDGNKKPNAKEVVEAAGDDKEFADRLLKAEVQASGGEPRSTVKEGLEKVKAGSEDAS